MNNRRKWFLFFCFCAAVLWLFFIFSNSMENMQVSGDKSEALLQFLDQKLNLNLDLMNTKKNNHILRKLAHFGEYFLLELLMFSVLKEKKQAAVMSFLLCVTVAFLDEGLQMLSDRHADLRDVLLDSCGALTAMLMWLLFGKIRAIFRKRKNTAK